MVSPLILYVPGKNPKPVPEAHRPYLWRALLEGVRRADFTDTAQFSKQVEFQICAWNVVFYAQTRDLSPDVTDIEHALHTPAPTMRDIAESKDWHRRMNRWFYTVADYLPWVIPWLPNQTLQATIADTHRYFSNYRGIASEVREVLKTPLRAALAEGRPVLVVGHSLGSVITYDALWELTWQEGLTGKVDFVSLGSPLGMRFVQRRLQGNDQRGEYRFPRMIRRWDNVAAVGDLAALDETVSDDFRYMIKHAMVERITDHVGGVFNFFRESQILNVHRSYGYLINPVTGSIVTHWWQNSVRTDEWDEPAGQWVLQPVV